MGTATFPLFSPSISSPSTSSPSLPMSFTALPKLLICPELLLPAYLVEEPFGELLEALGAHEALLVVQLTIAVDDFLCWCKAASTALTDGIRERIRHVAAIKKQREQKEN